jgi:hypothetical protein
VRHPGWEVPVMEGPDQGTAAGRGHLRAARADRDRVVEVLKTAFVQERLDQDELDVRVGQALTARTYAELAALTADIPDGPAGPAAASPPAAVVPRTPAQIMTRAAYWSVICLLVAVILAMGGIVLLAPVPALVAVGLLGQGITDVLDARSSRSQLPPGRGRRRLGGPADRGAAAPEADASQPGASQPGTDRTGAEMRARRPGIPARPGVSPVPGPA